MTRCVVGEGRDIRPTLTIDPTQFSTAYSYREAWNQDFEYFQIFQIWPDHCYIQYGPTNHSVTRRRMLFATCSITVDPSISTAHWMAAA